MTSHFRLGSFPETESVLNWRLQFILCGLNVSGITSSVITFKPVMLKPKNLYMLEVSASKFISTNCGVHDIKKIYIYILIDNTLNPGSTACKRMRFEFWKMSPHFWWQVLRRFCRERPSCSSPHTLFLREWCAMCSLAQVLRSIHTSASSALQEKRSVNMLGIITYIFTI